MREQFINESQSDSKPRNKDKLGGGFFSGFSNGFLNRVDRVDKGENVSEDQSWLESQFGNLSTSEKEEATDFSEKFNPSSSYVIGMSQENFNLKMEMDPIFRRMFSQENT